MLANGVALPMPRGYIVGAYVDQGVDYSAPGGTPLYAMGDGVIIGEGISGFGPNAPILQITSGPLKGLEVYYGHAGSDLVSVGQHVSAGQQISHVGYGIVGISTGPHLEIGFYPPGPRGSGSKMLGVINALLHQHPTGRVWGATASATRVSADLGATSSSAQAQAARSASVTSSHASSATGAEQPAPAAPATAAQQPARAAPTAASAPA
ncbi:MAG TPA: M23 family metallopeptidase, partial [Solirubrobacteraceae bacterium]|nr:M23 family metallopeptidase [Solirubrobacteraceae bacterium]